MMDEDTIDVNDNGEEQEQDLVKGYTCHHCHQFVKKYKRPIYAVQVTALIALYHANKGTEYVHMPSALNGRGVVARGGDYTKLVYWKLIEPMPATRLDQSKRTGWWKITEFGKQFVEGTATVPAFVWVFNGEPIEFSDKHVNIEQVVRSDNKRRFNYAKLMANEWGD